jgi:hypothetical protein
MSATLKLTETPREGLAPVNPKLAQQYEQIVDTLGRRLGPAHAQLFAAPAPVALAGTGRPGLAWFSARDGEAQPVTDLAPGEAETLRREAARLVAEVAAFADGIEGEGEASRDLARLLRDALVVPDEDSLWSVDGQPVLVAWGFRRAGADGPAVTGTAPITGTGAALPVGEPPAGPGMGAQPPAPGPMPAPSAEGARRRTWFAPVLWLVFVLLCGVLGDRLLQACALGSEGWPDWIRRVLPDHCPAPSVALDPDGAAILAAIRATDEAVRGAELALTRRALTCDAVCPVPPPRRAAIEPAPAIPPDLERRLTGIERGRNLELTLAWEGPADLDLHVICPDRTRIWFERRAACGGRLVADQNQGGGTPASRPVEHVIWDDAPAPTGRYGVEVSLYARHGEARPEVPFQIVLSRQGQVVEQRAGRIAAERVGQGVLSFDMPMSASPSPAPPASAATP